MSRQTLELQFHVMRVLEKLDIPYVIIGAFGGVTYGLRRATYDVDMVVDLDDSRIDALVGAFPGPRYYADPYQMRDSIRLGILFNIIDSSRSEKVDLIPLTMEPSYDFALQNRVRRRVPTGTEFPEEAWVARAEDIIVGKLMAWQEGRQFKHESDIRDILLQIKRGYDPQVTATFEPEYVEVWAHQIGEDALRLWEHIKQIVETD